MNGVRIRQAGSADRSGCLAIVMALPAFFDAAAHDRVAADLEAHHSWVADDGEAVAGFVTVARRSGLAAEIAWAAVRPDLHGYGIGTRLVDRVCEELALNGVALLEVKTLDRSAGDPGYLATQEFWENRGFVQVDLVDPLPGWSPGNPCAVHVAALARTR